MYQDDIIKILQNISDRFMITKKDPLIKKDKKLRINIDDKVFQIKTIDFIFCYYQSIEYISNINPTLPSFLSILYNNASKNEWNIPGIVLYLKNNTRKVKFGNDKIDIKNGDVYTEDFKNLIKKISDSIKNSKRSYVSFNFTIHNLDKNISHRNMIFVYKQDENIDIIWYEPHGGSGQIIDICKEFVMDLEKNLEDHFERILLIEPTYTCPYGLQKLIQIPYCVMFSYLWVYIIIKIMDRQRRIVDITWIQDIDSIMYNFLSKYSNHQRENFILSFSYMLLEEFLSNLNIDITRKDDEDLENKFYIMLKEKKIIDIPNIRNYNMLLKYRFIRVIIDMKFNYKQIFERQICNDDEECKEGECIDYECVVKKEDGSICLDDIDCRSGFCNDGFCDILIEPEYESLEN